MPIKFRCAHCGQFLGIFESRAGSLVDCPACGRTVRVPTFEGKAEPVPEMQIQKLDPDLVQALQGLSGSEESSGEGKPETDTFEAMEDTQPIRNGPGVKEPGPAPVPEVVSVEPLERAEPISVEPANAKTKEEPGGPQSSEELGSDSSAWLEELVSDEGDVIGRARRGGGKDRQSVFSFWVLVSAAGAFVLVLGYWLGSGEPENVAGTAASKEGEEGAAVEAVDRPAVRGRITYKTEAGESRADAGARVIVFPEGETEGAKVPVRGLRADPGEEKFEESRGRLRALGGDAAVADEQGHFAISLATAGTYRVLVLSHYRERGEDSGEGEVTNELGRFFDRPHQLLGEVELYLGRVKYDGKAEEIWDHSFEGR